MSAITKLSRALVMATAGLAFVAGAAAQDMNKEVAGFYKGKRLKLLIGSGPGGGYDTYARLLARHMPRHIPGNPQIQPQNMDGAGSVIVTNYIVNVAPKDGTVIGAVQREIALVQILGQPGPKFEAKDIQWLGSLASEAGVCAVAARAGVKSFADVFEREFVMGGTGPNVTEFNPALLNNLLGAKFKLIKGYPSTPPTHLAIQRGEVDGICQSWASFKEQAGNFLTDGKIKPLVQMSLKPDPEMDKLGVPMLSEFITAERVQPGFTVGDVETYFNLVLASGVMGRPYAVAPGVPQARVDALRAAFVATTQDPKFVEEAKKSRRDVELVRGEEIQAIVQKMAAPSKEKLAKLDDLMKFQGKTEQVKIEMVRHTGKVTETKRQGREIVIDHAGKKASASISGSQTKVTINGKKDKRSAVTVGMTCTFVYAGPGTQAEELVCKK